MPGDFRVSAWFGLWCNFFLENNLSATSWRLFLYGQLYGISHAAILYAGENPQYM